MDGLSREDITPAIVEIIKDAVSRGEALHVPGLGTFEVEHHSSQIEELSDGRLLMNPPHDEVVFTPED